MSDPADKSDDLIAELAKLMAASPGSNQPSVQPVARPAPLDPLAGAPASPTPIRIPGMDLPRPAAAAPAPAAPRAPVTGAIRIPGMDQPAPVSTSAPVSKFDFGKPVAAAAPIRQEPLSSLAERLAPQNPYGSTRVEPNPAPTPAPQPQPQPTPIRIPSDLKPVSENRSFAQSPSLSVAQPTPAPSAPPAAGGNDFSFDFGFGRNPPASASPPRPTPEHDPIADLIAAEMGGETADFDDDGDETPEPAPQLQREPRPAPAPVAPVVRTMITPQQAPQKPTISPISAAQQRPASSAPIPLKPVSVAPRAPEADRFAISPGVGLNMKPPASQPLGPAIQRAPEPAPRAVDTDSDPMSEIESLIGEAVRVELHTPGPVKVQAAQQRVAPHVELESEADLEEEIGHHAEHTPPPVVPPLNTQFAPRRSGLKDDAGHNGAEDAIIAAAAATGAHVDRLEPAVGDESPYRRLKVKPAKPSLLSGGMRQYVGMAVAGTLLLAAGLGLYWVLNMGRTANVTGASAPQLTADATPVKEIPAAPAASDTEIARSPVLEQMAGASTTPSAEQLVSTDETNGGPVTRDVTAASDDSESGLASRKVRTVTVRPDGTIVSGDDAVAGAEELPVERPNVPAVPATDTTNLLGDTTSVAMTDPVTDNTALTASTPTPLTVAAAETDIQPVFDPTNVAPTPITFPVRSANTNALAFSPEPQNPVNAVITGAQTPNGQIDLLGGETQPVRVAEATPEPVRASNAVAYVQLSSSPSEADAQSSLRSATNRFGSLFGGSQLIVVSADLGQKGTWYRVRLPASSLSEANRICSDIKANGGDCISTNG